MSKILLAGVTALGVAGFAAITPASANEQRADGARTAQLDQWEFSDHRRRYRHRHGRRYYRPYYSYRPYYYAPYYAYRPYYARPYYRPYYHRPYYYGPGVSFSFRF